MDVYTHPHTHRHYTYIYIYVCYYIHIHEGSFGGHKTLGGRRSRPFVVHIHSGTAAGALPFVYWFRFSRPPLIIICIYKTCLCLRVCVSALLYLCIPAENEKNKLEKVEKKKKNSIIYYYCIRIIAPIFSKRVFIFIFYHTLCQKIIL